MPASRGRPCDVTFVGVDEGLALNKNVKAPLENEPKLVKTLVEMSKISRWRRGHSRTADNAKTRMVILDEPERSCTLWNYILIEIKIRSIYGVVRTLSR